MDWQSVARECVSLPLATPMHFYTYMDPAHYHEVATIQRVKGLDGTMVAVLRYPKVALPVPKVVFVLLHHTYVPYPVVHWELKGGRLYFQLEEVSSREAAQKLPGAALFLPAQEMRRYLQGTYYRLLGYKVVANSDTQLGTVVAVEDRLHQPVLTIDYGGKLLSVPCHEAFIRTIDDSGEVLYLDLPPNYLGSAMLAPSS